MSSFPKTQKIVFIAHLKRNPNFKTREEFWKYWEGHHGPLAAPMLSVFGGLLYQQIQVSGTVVSNQPLPNTRTPTNEVIEFDGIAIFTLAGDADVPGFLNALAGNADSEDPKVREQVKYNLEVVKPDELVLLDAKAPGMGVVRVETGNVVGFDLAPTS
ncbi:uncharacterized protein AB675_3093 [Cyphellophora attinorum]|uniref:EthD domain-containing protein n=1 Tax=Cyphellophora attinorum TaxID=1664694 RepID=A0A0N1H5W7_9EURO|nr:uncharacterized protein AB675_3093 [Phialophora attinorum]KPI37924.1 hypothetical protein AB675_3093 [Phialophora attinorum]